MTTYQVTQADLDQLEAFSAAGNVLGYYGKLTLLGDRYANLATGVAAADTFAGNIARQFAQNAAAWKSGATVTLSGTTWANISIELMRNDLAARKEQAQAQNSGALLGQWSELPWQTIRDYHVDPREVDTKNRHRAKALDHCRRGPKDFQTIV